MNNFIGGANAGEGNRIRFNGDGTLIATLFGEGGIVVFAGATQNSILANSITANNGLGIDLALNNADGVTPNDVNDEDVEFLGAAINLQNFPVITMAESGGISTRIRGTLNSQMSRTYRIEFFGEPTSDGEGSDLYRLDQRNDDRKRRRHRLYRADGGSGRSVRYRDGDRHGNRRHFRIFDG